MGLPYLDTPQQEHFGFEHLEIHQLACYFPTQEIVLMLSLWKAVYW